MKAGCGASLQQVLEGSMRDGIIHAAKISRNPVLSQDLGLDLFFPSKTKNPNIIRKATRDWLRNNYVKVLQQPIQDLRLGFKVSLPYSCFTDLSTV